MKTRVYNLIVLDESGSMSDATKSTINGCNETINVCRSGASDLLDQYISIYAFQSGTSVPSRYLVKNVPAAACEHITGKDYEPLGCTPLLDAVGSTMVDLMATVKAHPGSIGSVTVITDGEENSSEHYTLKQVVQLIDQVKEMGWNVTFIGANIDAKTVGASLHIDNTLQFDNDEKGTAEMWEKERHSREAYNCRVEACMTIPCASEEDRAADLREASRGYFKRGKKDGK